MLIIKAHTVSRLCSSRRPPPQEAAPSVLSLRRVARFRLSAYGAPTNSYSSLRSRQTLWEPGRQRAFCLAPYCLPSQSPDSRCRGLFAGERQPSASADSEEPVSCLRF